MIHALVTGVSLTSMHIANVVLLTVETRRQRRALSKLDDRLLRDIGLSRSEAAREARRLF